MKKQEIIEVLAELHRITGFRVSLHDADYSEIAAYPAEKRSFCRLIHSIPGELDICINCDKGACKKALSNKSTHIYTCRYGMIEAVSPLYNFGTLTGFLMMGQVQNESSRRLLLPKDAKYDKALAEKFREAIHDIPSVKSEMIRSYVKIMTICAQYLTLSNAIPHARPTVAELAKNYIYDNYSEKFGIKDICASIGCSKSTLLTAFKKQYGVTVGDYITEVRLSEAIRMLNSADRSIGEVAMLTGFSDQSYFSKVFSARYGMPPSEYRSKEEE